MGSFQHSKRSDSKPYTWSRMWYFYWEFGWFLFIPKGGRKHSHTNSYNFAMTLLSQDDHHTAGAWAACVSNYGLQILSVVQSKEELEKCFRSLATKVRSTLKARERKKPRTLGTKSDSLYPYSVSVILDICSRRRDVIKNTRVHLSNFRAEWRNIRNIKTLSAVSKWKMNKAINI